jgi:UMF1 family MFS transporter
LKVIPIVAWCLYDWACAAFSIVVMTFIFATYFTSKVAVNPVAGTYQWANATALAGIIIAFLSPVLGAIADHTSYHKRWVFFFTAVANNPTTLLWFAYPNPQAAYFTLTCVVIGTIGYELAIVFYNSYLPSLATPDNVGRISGIGWGSGYLGGIVALSLVLVFFVNHNHAWLNQQYAEHIRICGPFVGVWYALFAIPFFLFVPDVSKRNHTITRAVKLGMRELMATLKKLPQEKNIFIYLFAHMIYADGLNTLFAFGGIYAAGTYGLTFPEVLLFGISMNVTAGLGAISLSWVDDYLGAKFTVMGSLIIMSIVGIPILFLHQKSMFWAIALLLSVFVGPVQSASRSKMVHLIAKKETATEMFGLYSLSGRVTAFIGPWLLGALTLYFHSQRVGMATIMVFFLIGALLLLPVRMPNH